MFSFTAIHWTLVWGQLDLLCYLLLLLVITAMYMFTLMCIASLQGSLLETGLKSSFKASLTDNASSRCFCSQRDFCGVLNVYYCWCLQVCLNKNHQSIYPITYRHHAVSVCKAANNTDHFLFLWFQAKKWHHEKCSIITLGLIIFVVTLSNKLKQACAVCWGCNKL